MRARYVVLQALIFAVGLSPGWASACESGGVEVEVSSDSAVRLTRVSGPGMESVDQDSEIFLLATNRTTLPGELVIEATILSEEGIESRGVVATIAIQGEAEVTVPVPVSKLVLPRLVRPFSSLVILTAFLRFSDGSREHASPHLDLYCHSEGDGWLVYGDAESAEFLGAPGKGERHISLTSEETRTGPAFSRKVSESTNWRPVEDEGVLPALPTTTSDRAGVKICIQQMSIFSDAGIGEDFWTSTASTARPSRGAWVAILREGSYLWVNFVGDGRGAGDPGSGCTEVMAEPADPSGTYDYTIQIWTVGNVQGNVINTAYNGNPVLDWTFTRSLTGNGTFEVTFDPTANTGKAFDVYMVGAYGLYRHAAGLIDETFRFRLDAGSSNSSVDRVNDTVRIGDLRADRKFIIAHEMGHLLGDFATGNNDWKTVNTKCHCYESSSCPAEYGSHTMISKERSRCAVAEGFAHFYAAAVFNSHTDASPYECWFHYYKEVGGDSTPTVNCELDWPDGPFDEAYMENNCAVPWIGMGTELDWMRTFWDVLSDPPSPHTMQDIVQWIDSADFWHNYFAYNELDAAADLVGGDLDAKWDVAKGRNGVDWPRYSLLFVDGFESDGIDCWGE